MNTINFKAALAIGLLSLMVCNTAAATLWTDVAAKANLNTLEKVNVSASKHRLVQAAMPALERLLYDRTTNQ